ncbi:hypothetical protein [Oceanobacillus profundus]|uniref:hypothetical protein n=1 Tax=Oceanobacillus TaxID=182709 RepID=UPI0013142803|nr:hypothetical protein [Oceanobacillus profundus]MBR3118377.1 hypothetical protein [Oceanobacillus sp.]MCM3396946.1 hypothetical protein [Oceanobacillus profundus]MDO6448246.1 hypothetical protein [Oceanobacillus profundus]
MRMNEKQWNIGNQKDILSPDLHRFTELEGRGTNLEIASELGIAIEDVKLLKKKLNRA